jgi:pimeloyl-ACP methyl ester carboxylesterase
MAGREVREIFMILRALIVAIQLCWLAPGGAHAGTPIPYPETPGYEPAPCAFGGVDASWARTNRVECGWLTVPQSRTREDGRKLRLWVAIARADAPDKDMDPIVYLHGGPGLATVDYFFPYFPQSKTWPGFRKTRDIVFFDQRGTGRSEPSFCPELRPALEAIERRALAPRPDLDATKRAYAACRPRMLEEGFDFRAYHSIATVDDAEDLRRALGVRRWNLYGISYGSLVGLQYLRQHPEHVRAAILDSVYPPNSPNGAEQIGATASAYAALQRVCRADATCAERFPDLLGLLKTATDRLDAKPIVSGDDRINGRRFGGALWSMLVASESAPWVPLAIERAVAGDAALVRRVVAMFGASGGLGTSSPGQALAVNCYELQVGHTTPVRREMMRRFPQLASQDGLPEAVDELCAAWQREEAPLSHLGPVASDVPVLLYGGDFDPATPFDDALLASRHLSRSTLVRVPGASHAAFYYDDCTRGIAHAFLDNPDASPDLACLARADTVVIPTDGLDEFLDAMAQ